MGGYLPKSVRFLYDLLFFGLNVIPIALASLARAIQL